MTELLKSYSSCLLLKQEMWRLIFYPASRQKESKTNIGGHFCAKPCETGKEKNW